MAAPELSLTEWTVLALLTEGPSHPFGIARLVAKDSPLGRVLTVRRPLVYRALDRLVAAGLAEPVRSEPGEGGPERTVHRVTPSGRRAARAWLDRPVAHVRDLRIEFLVKLQLLARAGRPRGKLVTAQRAALADTLAALATLSPGADDVERWRHHQALAVAAFLADLG